jgi:hypothetical protein
MEPALESVDPPAPWAEAAERRGEDEDLQVSVVALSTLATGQLDLEGLLTSVAVFAVRAIPGADGAGLTLLEENRSDTVVTTAPFVREVDDIQYGLGQGPCITAAADAKTVTSGSLGGDPGTRAGPGSVPGSPASGCTVPSRCRSSPRPGWWAP